MSPHLTPHWMIRKMDMRIFRPIPQDELVKKIEAGEIAGSDELCPAGGYWFMLSEVKEVRRFLGDVDLSCLHIKLEGEKTSSTDALPQQKTSLIQPKITLEAAPSPVRQSVVVTNIVKEARPTEPVVQEFPEVQDEPMPSRTKSAVGVLIGLVIFIFVLVWFWSGSY